jgi:hypothetical protein
MTSEELIALFRKEYHSLIPSPENGEIILRLYERFNKGNNIGNYFSMEDFREILNETKEIGEGQWRKTMSKLLEYFIQNHSKSIVDGKYSLTSHATQFTNQIKNTLDYEYKVSPIIETLQLLNIDAKGIKDITLLRVWYERSFSSNTIDIISLQLSSLHKELRSELQKMTEILYGNASSSPKIQILTDFEQVLQRVTGRAKDISDSLDFVDNVLRDLEIAIDYFAAIEQDFTHEQVQGNLTEFEIAKQNHKDAIIIQQKVEIQLENLKSELSSITNKIKIANEKLTELGQHFDAQIAYATKYSKLLHFMLEGSRRDKNEVITLPNPLTNKCIYQCDFSFIEIKPFSFIPPEPRSLPYKPSFNEEVYQKKKKEIDFLNNQDERTYFWLDECEKELHSNKFIDFSKMFYLILEEENDEIIPIKVGFNLFQMASQSSHYQIDIKPIRHQSTLKTDISIWDMTIHYKG